jgi:hypothetical protein
MESDRQIGRGTISRTSVYLMVGMKAFDLMEQVVVDLRRDRLVNGVV